MKKINTTKTIATMVFVIMITAASVYLSGIIIRFLEASSDETANRLFALPALKECIQGLIRSPTTRKLFFCVEGIFVILFAVFLVRTKPAESDTVTVAGKFELPVPAGEGQHGSAWFMKEKEIAKTYSSFVIDPKNPDYAALLAQGKAKQQEVRRRRSGEPPPAMPPRTGGKTENLLAADYKNKLPPNHETAISQNPPSETFETNSVGGGTPPQIQTSAPVQKRQSVAARFLSAKTAQVSDLPPETPTPTKNAEAMTAGFRNPPTETFETNSVGDGEPPPAMPPRTGSKTENLLAADYKNKLPTESVRTIKGGVVVGMKKKGDKERVFCLSEDLHTLIIGATRCGKTRGLVIQTIAALALAEESMVVSDPKGELYLYCRELLEKLGYKIRVIDFQEMDKSDCFNPLQQIIDAAARDDTDQVQILTRSFVNLLVEKAERQEPIWRNGEMSVIAGAILAVVIDNKDRPEFQNLTNVYEFIANMSAEIPNPAAETDKSAPRTITPLKEYVRSLPENHPAKSEFAAAVGAPDKTAASFFTSAMTTLGLYNVKGVYNITRKSDFGLERLGIDKEAFFYILPDQNTTFYPVATLMIGQQYERLVEYAKTGGERSNRLPRRVNFVLDEFGNFSSVNDFEAKMTVGAGYGIRFALFLQSFKQLVKKYGEEVAAIIKGNCAAWIYLLSADPDTLKEMETALGNYTTLGYSTGASKARYQETGTSSNSQLVGRPLLYADQLSKLSRPYQLLMQIGKNPAAMYAPDLSKWYFNQILGLGNEEHNKTFISISQAKRTGSAKNSEPKKLWGIWNRWRNGAAMDFYASGDQSMEQIRKVEKLENSRIQYGGGAAQQTKQARQRILLGAATNNREI